MNKLMIEVTENIWSLINASLTKTCLEQAGFQINYENETRFEQIQIGDIAVHYTGKDTCIILICIGKNYGTKNSDLLISNIYKDVRPGEVFKGNNFVPVNWDLKLSSPYEHPVIGKGPWHNFNQDHSQLVIGHIDNIADLI